MPPLPVLLSVPHAGTRVPPEVGDLCILSKADILADSDEGADRIYLPLEAQVTALVATTVARAVVDVNRAADDFRKDGVIKTHTCYEVPVYREPPSGEVIQTLIRRYYDPYHADLTRLAEEARAGIDCHTMSATGPPVGPDPGRERPAVCLSNAEGAACPPDWIASLAACLEDALGVAVSINDPFKGGYIVRSRPGRIPWIQMEYSRGPFATDEKKRDGFLAALTRWCRGR